MNIFIGQLTHFYKECKATNYLEERKELATNLSNLRNYSRKTERRHTSDNNNQHSNRLTIINTANVTENLRTRG